MLMERLRHLIYESAIHDHPLILAEIVIKSTELLEIYNSNPIIGRWKDKYREEEIEATQPYDM